MLGLILDLILDSEFLGGSCVCVCIRVYAFRYIILFST